MKKPGSISHRFSSNELTGGGRGSVSGRESGRGSGGEGPGAGGAGVGGLGGVQTSTPTGFGARSTVVGVMTP